MKLQKTQPQPQPEYKFQNPEQEYLFAILGELRMQRRTINSMNTAIQVIGFIMILSVIGSCLLAVFGTSLF
jgi:hypothetical protein